MHLVIVFLVCSFYKTKGFWFDSFFLSFYTVIFLHLTSKMLFKFRRFCFKSVYTFLAGTPSRKHLPPKSPDSHLTTVGFSVAACVASVFLIVTAICFCVKKRKKRFDAQYFRVLFIC